VHLLDDDLGWLSRGRDADATGYLDMSDHVTFVRALAAKNQRWVDAAAGLSQRVVVDLLAWSGAEVDAYDASLDLRAEGYVSWAGGSVPKWFNLAQEFTERWVHAQQIRAATGHADDGLRYLADVLRTFVWACPAQYGAVAEPGTVVRLELGAGGCWQLTASKGGGWTLTEGRGEAAASASFTDDAAWKWLTGAEVPADSVVLDGDATLTAALLPVRAIIV
jgi:hypothetical protein